jgi:Tol biopolymer transport system component
MGVVWRATDTTLGRDVAIKVLPGTVQLDPERTARFEREARLLASLNHPNIAAIYGVGSAAGVRFLAMELVEGDDLAARLARGALPVGEVLDLARQVAEGLEVAHEKGIIHRDLKPANVKLTPDGRVKLLDFGLAKALDAQPESTSSAPLAQTVTSPMTAAQVILGTAAYMSPEQARGKLVDRRADIWAFGCMLYECLTAKRPFEGQTASDTIAKILEREPDWAALPSSVPVRLRGLLRRCLEKDARKRLRDIGDARIELEEPLVEPAAPVERPSRRSTRTWAALALLAAVMLGAAGLLGWLARGSAAPPPSFRLLTRERGTVTGARFVPNTSDIVFSAQWSGAPSQWYSGRLDQPGTRALAGSEGILLGVTANGEGVGVARTYLSHAVQVGALCSLPLAGGATREWISAGVWGACPGPGAGELAAVIGDFGGEIRLEWPLGRVVVKSLEVLRSPLIRNDLLAFVKERGNIIEEVSLEIVERSGKTRTLTTLSGFSGMAWGPDGREIWVSTYRDGASQFLAVDLEGRSRVLLRHAGRFEIQDVDANGRVLAALHSYQRQTFGRARGASKDVDLGWLDAQATTSLTLDGSTALLAPLAEWSRVDGNLFVRSLAGGPAQTVGLGQRQSTISPDGKWVVTCTVDPEMALVLIPTGPGVPRRIPLPDFAGSDFRADLLPDGKLAIVWSRWRSEPFAMWRLDLETSALEKLTPPGASPYAYQQIVSPDGRWIAYVDSSQPSKDGANTIGISRTDGSEARTALILHAGEAISGWGPDSASFLVWNRNALPAEVDRVDLATGSRTRVLSLMPPDPVGVQGIQVLLLTPDASAYAYNVTRKLSELYVVEGLR